MTATLLTLALLAPPAPQATPQLLTATQDAPTVEPFELTVRRKVTTPGIEIYEEPGVQVRVAVRTPGRKILSVHKEESSIGVWEDDQGTDLAGGLETGFFHWLSMDMWGDEKKEATVAKISTEAVPAVGAKSLKMRGSLAFVTASKSEERSVHFAVKDGETFELAGVDVTIKEVSKSGGGVSFDVVSQKELSALREIKFLAGEQEVEIEDDNKSSFSFGGPTTYTRSFTLAESADSLTLVANMWTDMEITVLPISLDSGAGL